MRGLNKLSATKVQKEAKPGRYGDGGGLWLQVTEAGTKSWLFRFMREGVAREMGLGAIHTLGLADARQRAAECRRLLLDGIDPIAARDRRRMETRLIEAQLVTFRDCAEQYVAAHRASWRNAKHRAQWDSTLATYALPIIGDLSVAAIDTSLVLKVIEPIWQTKPETAGRVRGRIQTILDWAKARSYRQGDNPARWTGHLDQILPARGKVRRVKHHAALPYRDLPAFMIELRAMEGVSPLALEFAILTAARTGEAIGATWDEIDLDAKLWTISGERMKSGRSHRVPLSGRCLEILAALPREKGNPALFIGGKAGMPLSNMALLATLRRMSRADLTAHGFRSTFRDWAAETTGYPNEVVEMALAHAVSDKVEAAYRRGDLFAKRARLMRDWADFAARPASAAVNVVALREVAS
jgi:integrase